MTVCVGLFVGLHRWLRRRKIRGALPWWGWPLLAVLLTAGAGFVENAGDAEHARIRNFLQGVAPTYAQELERLGHARLTLDTAADDPDYVAMIEATKRWKRVNPTLSDIYTYRRMGAEVRLMVSAETDYDRDGRIEGWREQRVPLGTLYEQADDRMLAALEGTPTFSDEPVKDEWGHWVSAQVPLRDAAGRVEGAVGVDFPAAEWMRAVALGRQRMMWFMAIPVLLLGFAGTLTGVLRAELGARRDVEAKLRGSEASLRTAIDSLPCDFWMMDCTGHYTLLNAKIRLHWGDNTGLRVDDLELPDELRTAWAEQNRRALAGETVGRDYAHTHAGETRHYSSVVAPVRVDGQVTAILGVDFDITERVKAEQALRCSEARHALHVRQTPQAIIMWNLAFEVTAWNPAAERIFGFTEAEAVGRGPAGFIVPESARDLVAQVWEEMLRHRAPVRRTNENLTKDGRTIVCEWYNTPLIDEAGALVGVLSNAQDVTERATLEHRLRQAQKLESLGQLAAGVAHEFNNLLSPMLMQTDLVAYQYPHDTKLLAYLKPVQHAIAQATQLTQRILAVGRRAAEQPEWSRLSALVEHALVLLRPSLDREIVLTVAIDPDLGLLLVERSNVVQIVMNLVLNARDTLLEKRGRQAGAWTPRIEIAASVISCSPPKDDSGAPFDPPRCWQRLTVTDNGCGVPAEARERLFEPFFTTKGPGQGTGLGLALVWNVAHALGGWIDFEDGLGGVGTRFHVYFPQLEPPPALAKGAAVPPVVVRTVMPKRILIAEDNALVSATFSTLLKTEGHSVETALDGEACWEAWRKAEGAFDVVLADFNMPRLNGAELLARLRAAGYAGRIVIVSGYLATEKLNELTKLGASAVLRKPVKPARLIEAIG